MIKRTLLATVLAVGASGVAFAQQNATFVLVDGQHLSGTMSYSGGNDLKLNINGQERSIPQSDIAVVAFDAATPSPTELSQITEGATELERNTIVLRDGSVVHGKLYNLSADGRMVTINTTSTDRRDIPSDSIARIYMNAGAARRVYAGAAPQAVATSGSVAPGAISVNANQPWTDTGITVKKGDRVSFQSSGTVTVAPGSAPVTPDGLADPAAARGRLPVQQMPIGGLIFRVGNGAPSPVGSNAQPITMPADGRLYLGVNDDQFGDNTGAFNVTIVR